MHPALVFPDRSILRPAGRASGRGKRDMPAVTELSSLLHNEASHRDLNKAGLGVIRRSLDRLVAQR